uniref:15-oxoprostaglandin 13-reductase n=1 Tax=Plectus sambesii TaxID=2011161 RepID=A0A914WIG1_9BILA
MNESTGVNYISPWELNRPIKGLGGIGEVIHTAVNCQLSVGDLVTSADMIWPWAKRFVSDDKAMKKVNLPNDQSPSIVLSCLGMIGLTSLLGIQKKGRIDPNKKQTLVVSGAAGACGSLAGQIGRLEGCQRVVGICGSEEKCEVLVNQLGFDAAVNYKTPDVAEKLKASCPNGIDVYFDNVGGLVSDVVISQMNENGSVILCGQIAVYNEDLPYPPPIPQETQDALNQRNIQRDRFTVVNYPEDFAGGLQLLGQWVQEGRLKVLETVADGIENTGQAFVDMMNGRNTGKQLIKVAERNG